MLGLILLFWIGKYYYKLAEEYDKSKWGYAIIGIIAYYAGTFIVGIIIVLINPSLIDNTSNVALSLMMLPFGLLTTYGLYTLLKKKFEKNHVNALEELENIGKEID